MQRNNPVHDRGYRLSEIWADPDEIEGVIRKMEMNYPGIGGNIFVIAEGPNDYEVYSRCLSRMKCTLRIANSKENVAQIVGEIMKKMPDKGKKAVIGIIDRDFAFFESEEKTAENIFFTDTHDLETMMIASGALERVLAECEKNAFALTYTQAIVPEIREGTLRDSLIRAARPLGLSVFLNNLHQLNISFKHINCKKNNAFSRFIDSQTLRCDTEALEALICERNAEHKKAFLRVFRKVLKEGADHYFNNPWHICRGHDLICVLLCDINYRFFPKDGIPLKGRDLEYLFRRLYGPEDFIHTGLFRMLREWEKTRFGKNSQLIFEESLYAEEIRLKDAGVTGCLPADRSDPPPGNV